MILNPKIYYFIGQSGAGKTTLAKLLKDYLLNELSINNVIHIDGDDIRDIFQNKDYSEKGRRINIQKGQDIATFLNKKGYYVIISLVSPYEDQRENFKQNPNVIEIYLHTTDIRGKEQYHVLDYQKPNNNFLDIDTTNSTINNTFLKLLYKLLDIIK